MIGISLDNGYSVNGLAFRVPKSSPERIYPAHKISFSLALPRALCQSGDGESPPSIETCLPYNTYGWIGLAVPSYPPCP